MVIRAWVSVPHRNPPAAFPACQQVTESQPETVSAGEIRAVTLLTGDIAQNLLILWRSEFGDPVVLTTTAYVSAISIACIVLGTYQVGAMLLISARHAMMKLYPISVQT